MINPYLIFSATYLAVFMAYQFKWSELYPKITVPVMFFLLSSILISATVGLATKSNFKKINKYSFKYSRIYLFIALFILLGTVVDGIFSGGFPILGTVNYDSFGIKSLNPLIQYIAAIFAYMCVSALIDTHANKIKLVCCLCVAFVPFIMALSRGMIFSTAIVCLLLIVTKKKIKKKRIVIFLCVSVFGAYAFGILGNVRLNYQVNQNESTSVQDTTLAMNIGLASQKFADSPIPKPFFWTYLYATSPIANLQTTINNKYVQGATMPKFIVTQWMPDYISQKIYPSYSTDIKNASNNTQVTAVLTVGGIYLGSYILWGWFGVIAMFIYMMIFAVVYAGILWKIAPKYFNIGISLLTSIYLMSVFDNMLSFSGISLQLVAILLFGIMDKKKE
ncbi:hypothetical protein [Lactiplantibacillus plantarum]|uniref:hypothetical protein n=1 Tax=Lactiplantibacillus plantarum TaxID=1590 RepID=UPI000C7EF3C5|nr:hypothetical protein [Lactiplantibacillus plantarum]